MSDFIDYDHFTGVSTHHDYDESSKKTIITQSQDVEAILKNNKMLRDNPEYKKAGIKNDMYHIGSIPLVVAMEWKKLHGVDIIGSHTQDTLKKAEKLLASPEYSYLRTVNRI